MSERKTTNQFPHLDSFKISSFIIDKQAAEPINVILSYENIKYKARISYESICIDVGGEDAIIYFDRTHTLKNNPKSLYFICPECQARVRKIYMHNGLKCRICAELLYPLQKVSKFNLPRYQMVKLYEKLDSNTECDISNVMDAKIPPQPSGMSYQEYCRIVKAINQKGEEFINNLMRSASNIFRK